MFKVATLHPKGLDKFKNLETLEKQMIIFLSPHYNSFITDNSFWILGNNFMSASNKLKMTRRFIDCPMKNKIPQELNHGRKVLIY